MSDLQKKMMRSNLPPCVPVPRRDSSGSRKGRYKDFTPVMWNEHFTEMEDVVLDEQHTFRVYFANRDKENKLPLLLLLHGGGYSALTWAHFCTEVTSLIECQCLAIDLRGHGDTVVAEESELSANTLAEDVGRIIAKLYPDTAPPIMMIGHSMGGAICVHIASLDLVPSLIGIAVIDVVEGTAMEALASMQSFLRSRPQKFRSIQHAIEWCVRSGQIRNTDSARVSMPGQIINISTQKLATNELPLPIDEASTSIDEPTPNVLRFGDAIEEDAEEAEDTAPPSPTKIVKSVADELKYTWRIDLSKSEPYWTGWFENLSAKFLDVRVPKLLLLASIDGLDRTLTVGQMQGKFQLRVLARCGHAVHEDRPHEVAEVIATYMQRNKIAEACGEFTPQMPCC